MPKQIKYRHGDMALVQVSEIPQFGVTKSDSKVLITGSNNNPHFINDGEIYFVDSVDPEENVIGYLKTTTDNPILYHREHGEGNGEFKEAKISPGMYAIHRQLEQTHTTGMRPVED